jgi:penicillin-binding protein 1A
LRNVPVSEPPVPEGLVNVGSDWVYEEYAKGGGVSLLGSGNESYGKNPNALPPTEERNRILDLFRN